jgi:hypothetical protein
MPPGPARIPIQYRKRKRNISGKLRPGGQDSNPRKHNPSEEHRIEVRTLKAFGHPDSAIAHFVGPLTVNTLRKYYQEELDNGRSHSEAALALCAMQVATGNGDWTKANQRMLEFMCRVHLRWRTNDAAAEIPDENIPGMVERLIIEGGLPLIPYTPDEEPEGATGAAGTSLQEAYANNASPPPDAA